MAYTQWSVYKQDASMSAALDPIAPISGSDSLYIHRNGTAFTRANVNPGVSIPHGFTFGRLRTLLKFNNGGSGDFLGVACMLEQEDLSGTTGNAYGVIYRQGIGTVQDRLDTVQFTAGLGTFTALTTSGSQSYYDMTRPAGFVICLDVVWRLDIANYGGVLFQVQQGVQTDYSDLTTRFTYVDTSSPLTTTVNEAVVYSGAGTTTFQARYDQTFLVPRIAG